MGLTCVQEVTNYISAVVPSVVREVSKFVLGHSTCCHSRDTKLCSRSWYLLSFVRYQILSSFVVPAVIREIPNSVLGRGTCCHSWDTKFCPRSWYLPSFVRYQILFSVVVTAVIRETSNSVVGYGTRKSSTEVFWIFLSYPMRTPWCLWSSTLPLFL